MKSFPIDDNESQQPSVLWTGRKCEKCECKMFYVEQGGEWQKFTCCKCGEVTDEDLTNVAY